MNFYHSDDIPPDLARFFKPAPQLGLEKTPEDYTAKLVELFREVRRVLRDDGTLWLNLGDSYSVGRQGRDDSGAKGGFRGPRLNTKSRGLCDGLKHKDLVGIPWRVAFALQADGWYLRSDIIWAKPNPMPESVTDRPTRAHEYLFLMSKCQKYYYDADAIKEPGTNRTDARPFGKAGGNRHGDEGRIYKALPDNQSRIRKARDKQRGHGRRHDGFNDRWDALSKEEQCSNARNKRDIWTVATQPFPEAHFATFPKKLIIPCILAGCPKGGMVLDPFAGSGTTGIVAINEGRDFVGIELNPEYVKMAQARIKRETAQQRMFL